jgi:hypothetical protein
MVSNAPVLAAPLPVRPQPQPCPSKWYGMVWCPSYPLAGLGGGPQSLRPSGGSWSLDRAPAEHGGGQHAPTGSVPSALVQRRVSFPQAPAVAELRDCAISLCHELRSPSSARRRAARPPSALSVLTVEADQLPLELAREVVPVGVCPRSSSAARCVDPRPELLLN